MAKFRVTYIVSGANGANQTIEASRYLIDKEWIDFQDNVGDVIATIASHTVTRIERTEA